MSRTDTPLDAATLGAEDMAGHSLRTVDDRARREKLSPESRATLLCALADMHRKAANILEREALGAKLHLDEARK